MVGAIVMGSLVISLFFLRFWRNTRDRLFLYFALSFGIEAIHRLYSAMYNDGGEDSPLHYLVRLVAYGLIIWAILEKNLPTKRPQK
jgi:hypothetical protein